MKPRLLDLFCGAGGCTRGYQEAGFYVVGVDIEPQPNYCGDEFWQGDAIRFLEGGVVGDWAPHDFDAIHASPPCQDYSRAMRHLAHETPRLIDPVRNLLVQTGLPWVMENVPGAPIPNQNTLDGRYGLELCGSMFGLRIQRHRLFETSFPVEPLRSCNHSAPAMNPHNVKGRELMYEEFGRLDPERPWRGEMGVEWMGRYEAREAIPPIYTKHIGEYLLAHIESERRVAA